MFKWLLDSMLHEGNLTLQLSDTRRLQQNFRNIDDSLVREKNPETRAALEQKSQALKLELESIYLQDQQARSHEAELSQMMQAENARWTDLISRLERVNQ